MKIVIDAGHGLNTAGKRITLKGYAATSEWWLNDRIADRLQKKLAAYNCEVMRVDDTTGAKDVSLANRVAKANKWGADVYLSIHHNAGVGGRAAGGTVVYYYSSKAERVVQAKALYDAVVSETGLVGNRAQKVIKNDFYVLRNTIMPAFLIENGFMDSTTDVPIILTEAHADKTVQGLLNFLVREFKLVKVKEEKTEEKAEQPAVKVESAKSKDSALAGTYEVTASSLHLRAGAGTKKTSITTLPKGKRVQCYGYYTEVSGTKWLLLSVDGKTGYSSSKYLKKV